jgi:hypothetical protein
VAPGQSRHPSRAADLLKNTAATTAAQKAERGKAPALLATAARRTLELVTPGLGMMYIGDFWLGALVLVATLFATFLLIGVAISTAQVVHLADVLNFLGWLLLAHLLWLITRMFWVWNMVVPRSSFPTA